MASLLAELARSTSRDLLELVDLGLGLEAEVDLGVVVGPTFGSSRNATAAKRLLDGGLPAQRLEDADRPLRVDDALGDRGDLLLVRTPGRSDSGPRERLFRFGDGERQPAIQRDGLLFRARVRTLRHISYPSRKWRIRRFVKRARTTGLPHGLARGFLAWANAG